ncbi:hypothetical protein KSS87_004748 [Heliosperma pusillum]|nr:hypothetical protein KSS87_004748 [Heliosperma pusillum]
MASNDMRGKGQWIGCGWRYGGQVVACREAGVVVLWHSWVDLDEGGLCGVFFWRVWPADLGASGGGTSGAFLKKQVSKWGPSIFANFDLDFPDGLFPAGGKSDIEGIFPPPYFEWFQFNKGSTLCALLAGYQLQGKVLKDHPRIKLVISVSGSKFKAPHICDVAFKDPILPKSVHFIGDKDWLKLPSEDLASAFVDPLIIRHPGGHTVPRLETSASKDEAAEKEAVETVSKALKDDGSSTEMKMETTEVEAVQA